MFRFNILNEKIYTPPLLAVKAITLMSQLVEIQLLCHISLLQSICVILRGVQYLNQWNGSVKTAEGFCVRTDFGTSPSQCIFCFFGF